MNYQIKNDVIKVQINSFGAELNSLQKIDEDIEYIWQGDSKYWARHSPILFPIVGRLKEDSYFYKNQKYSMSQHCFARDYEFEIIDKKDDFVELLLKYGANTKFESLDGFKAIDLAVTPKIVKLLKNAKVS